MLKSGPAIFYDGTTSARHQVTVELDPAALLVRGPGGLLLASWPYDQLEQLAAPQGVFRIGRIRNPVLARVEVFDLALAHAIDELSLPVDRSGGLERRARLRVIGWSLAATVSLVLVAIFGVPLLADQIAPLVPQRVERKLGDAVDAQIRAMLDPGHKGQAFECGHAEPERKGRAALDTVIKRLEAAAGLPVPLRVQVVRRKDANAFALPGGYVYVFQGLIAKSESVDELAGVIAHEIGHVAHRDGTRSVLQAAGLSFLFGMVLGDFVGGGAVIIAAKTILQSSYSREVESKADLYAVWLITQVGGDPRALGRILTRIGGATEPGMKILLDHPETKQRVAVINAAAPAGAGTPMISKAEWADLQRICAGP